MKNICLISNLAPIYRKGIYQLLDKHHNVHWAFGEVDNIKSMEVNDFHGKVENLKTVKLPFNTYWLKGCVSLSIEKKTDYYIIIGDAKCISAWVCSILAKLRGKKVLYWTHGSLRPIKGLRRFVMNLFWKSSDCGLIYNKRSQQLMQQAGIGKGNFVTVYNSLNYPEQLKLRESLCSTGIYKRHFGNEYPTIAFIGRLIIKKRLDIILNVASMINADDSSLKVNVVIIGDGEDRERLERLVNEFGISECCWFYGACYDESINAELLYNADLCISPGEVGLTAIHAMMFGLPVATHNNFDRQGPEFEAIVENQTGFFFNENDSNNLYFKLKDWLHENSGRRETVRKQCYAIVDKYWNPYRQISIIDETLDSLK